MFYQFNHLGSPDYVKIESGNDFNFPPHLHQCFEIIIIKSGEMKITVNSNKYILKENDALLIFPNQIHSLESENSEHILCIFSPQINGKYSDFHPKVPFCVPVQSRVRSLADTFRWPSPKMQGSVRDSAP